MFLPVPLTPFFLSLSFGTAEGFWRCGVAVIASEEVQSNNMTFPRRPDRTTLPISFSFLLPTDPAFLIFGPAHEPNTCALHGKTKIFRFNFCFARKKRADFYLGIDAMVAISS